MNKKIVFAAVYLVVAFVAYIFLVKYSYEKYEEYTDIQRAKWIARGFSPQLFEGYVQEGFLNTGYGKSVVIIGIALAFGGLTGAFVLMTISDVLKERRKRTPKCETNEA